MAKKTRYQSLVKKVQDETIAFYEGGDKDSALYKALSRRKLRIVEKFTITDTDLVRSFQTLLYYKSRLPDVLLAFSLDREKMQEIYKLIDMINSAISSVTKAVETIRDSEFLPVFMERRGFTPKQQEQNQSKGGNEGNGNDSGTDSGEDSGTDTNSGIGNGDDGVKGEETLENEISEQ